MTTYALGNLKVGCIKDTDAKKEIFSAIAFPAGQAQRQNLGNAAVGQAWAVSHFRNPGPRQIKFVPPLQVAENGDRLLSQCFDQIIRIADRLEQDSLAVMPPNVDTTGWFKEIVAQTACNAIASQASKLNHVKNICFLVKDTEEASQYDSALRRLAEQYD